MSRAVLLRAGCPVAYAETEVPSGRVVCYGPRELDGAILEVGRAKVSRARKWLGDPELMEALDRAYVNFGAGAAK